MCIIPECFECVCFLSFLFCVPSLDLFTNSHLLHLLHWSNIVLNCLVSDSNVGTLRAATFLFFQFSRQLYQHLVNSCIVSLSLPEVFQLTHCSHFISKLFLCYL